MTKAPPPKIDFPPFRQRFPWIGGDLQTAGDFLFVPPEPIPAGWVERMRFPMEDGTGDVLLGALDHPAEAVPDRPLVVILHGLTGSEDSKYVRRTAARLIADGYPILRLNLRGSGPSMGLCREQYHSGRTQDIRAVLEHLRASGRFGSFVLVGYSLGANMLLKGLAEFGIELSVVAGCSISAPIDLAETARRFTATRNTLYQHWLLKRMKQEFARLPDGAVTQAMRDAVRSARTVVDFDNAMTAPRNGYPDAWAYYEANSAIRFLADIRVPTLLIHGLDDPWIPGRTYEAFNWSSNPFLTALLPPRGGHVGFHQSSGGSWADRCLEIFLERA
jgi:hypothetical protein